MVALRKAIEDKGADSEKEGGMLAFQQSGRITQGFLYVIYRGEGVSKECKVPLLVTNGVGERTRDPGELCTCDCVGLMVACRFDCVRVHVAGMVKCSPKEGATEWARLAGSVSVIGRDVCPF